MTIEQGRPLVPVTPSTEPPIAGPALPVVGYTEQPVGRTVEGAPALPVYVVSDVELGQFGLQGCAAVPMVLGSAVGATVTIGQRPIPVYLVGGSLSPSGGTRADLLTTAAPLAWWRLREASGSVAADASGNGRDGAYSASGVTLGGTYDGQAGAAFDGTNGFVNIYTAGLAGAFDGSTGTLIAWVRPASIAAGTQFAARVGNASNEFVRLARSAASGLASRQDAFSSLVSASGGTLTANTWQMLAMTWSLSANRVELFVGGVSASTASGLAAAWTVPIAPNGAVIGALQTDIGAARWNGQIADVALFSRVLTATEIVDLAGAPNP